MLKIMQIDQGECVYINQYTALWPMCPATTQTTFVNIVTFQYCLSYIYMYTDDNRLG